MTTRLKAMGIRDVLDNTFSIMREHFWTFQGVIFWSFLPSMLILLLGVLSLGAYVFIMQAKLNIPITEGLFWTEIFQSSFVSTVSLIIFGVVLIIGFLITTIIGSVYFTYGTTKVYQAGLHEEKCTVRDLFKTIKGKRLRIFVAQFLLSIFLWLVSLPGSVLSTVISYVAPGAGMAFSFLNVIIQLVVGFLFCLTPIVACLEDHQDPVKVISRAFQLLSGHRWRIFGTMLLVYLLSYALFAVVFGIVMIPVAVAIVLKNLIAIAIAGIFLIIALFVLNVLLSYGFGPFTAIYYDLLIRKEGYDLTLQLHEIESDHGLKVPEKGFDA